MQGSAGVTETHIGGNSRKRFWDSLRQAGFLYNNPEEASCQRKIANAAPERTLSPT